MALVFRDAVAGDAPAITAVMQAAWPDDTVDTGRIASLIRGVANRATCVALDGGRVIGFVDGFLTTSAAFVRRWEVDLLAVDAAYRGQGVARRLIAASVAHGRALGATVARGLIHTDNPASERAFAAAGFAPLDAEFQLYVSGAGPNGATEPDPAAHLLPVQTFGYSGVWLEGAFTPAAFQAALASREAHGADVAGVVLSPAHAATAEACGYALVGAYRWWEWAVG